MEVKQLAVSEAEAMFENMVSQIIDFSPDEVVAMSRSGFSYGSWVSQRLRLPLGACWINDLILICKPASKKIVFVDDNIVSGRTYQQLKSFMDVYHPQVDWKLAVMFTDATTPDDVVSHTIAGQHKVPFFIAEPMWGSMKISSGHGIRYRDE